MRVLLATWGSRGDVEPIAALALRLRELGAEVRVAAPPDEEFVAVLGRAGVSPIPLGPSVGSIVAGEKPPTAEDAFRVAGELVAARFETLMPAAEGCDALLTTGLMPAGARDVADKLGIRYVLATFHLLGLPSARRPPGRRPGVQSPEGETDIRRLWQQDAQRVNALYGPALNRHRAAIGLAPVDNVRDYVLGDRPWLAADATLCPSQGMTDLEVVQTGAWILPDDRPLPTEVEALLEAGTPAVYVGFGSLVLRNPELARVAIEAVRAHGRRVVLAAGRANLIAIDDLADCLVIGDINHQALFRRVAAVVHHGGAGTTTTAAAAGSPQVVVPQIADQPYWAGRVAELGIGAAHDGPTPTVESLADALGRALDPDTGTRAAAVGRLIGLDAAATAAKLLLEISA